MGDATELNADVSNRQIEAIREFYRDSRRSSDWFMVTQDLVDQFGVATCDNHWIHTDPVRASRESPYGGTIAHGFWTLSMLSHLAQQATGGGYPSDALLGINYGLDRVRFPGPAPAGSRIRLRYELVDVEARPGGRYLVKTHNEVEVEGQDKPAVVADWLFVLVY